MSGSPFDIESIVREVMRRLQVESGGPAEGVSAAQGQGAEGQNGDAGTMRLSHRVVSLAQLGEQLQGVRRLVVPPRAIVTPAVHDELRRNGIALQRDGEGTGVAGESDSRWRVLVGVHEAEFDAPGLLAGHPSIHCEVELIEPGKLDMLLRRFARRLNAAHTLGLVISSAPHVVACEANRCSVFRAAVVCNADEAADACRTLNANLFAVYDTSLARLWQLVRTALGAMCGK